MFKVRPRFRLIEQSVGLQDSAKHFVPGVVRAKQPQRHRIADSAVGINIDLDLIVITAAPMQSRHGPDRDLQHEFVKPVVVHRRRQTTPQVVTSSARDNQRGAAQSRQLLPDETDRKFHFRDQNRIVGFVIIIQIEAKHAVGRAVKIEADIAAFFHVGGQQLVHPAGGNIPKFVFVQHAREGQFAILERHAFGQHSFKIRKAMLVGFHLGPVLRQPGIKLFQQAYPWIHGVISSNE